MIEKHDYIIEEDEIDFLKSKINQVYLESPAKIKPDSIIEEDKNDSLQARINKVV